MRVLAFIFLIAVPFFGISQDFPEKSNRLVNDYTSTLSNIDIAKLENKLVQYDNETSVQIAIVIIKSLDGYEISDYAFRLGEKWGIGQAGTDNGALILVSINDRKMWIATGYGLEATVTDALAKRIVENEMKPRFQNGDFAGGLSAASDAIIQASRGEYQGKGNGGGRPKSDGQVWVAVLFFGVFFLLVVMGMTARVMDAREYSRINNVGFWAAWALLNATSRSHGGSWSSFSGGSGGFGGGGFGGGGGGGFGGFGGGSFGGGGAGGSW